MVNYYVNTQYYTIHCPLCEQTLTHTYHLQINMLEQTHEKHMITSTLMLAANIHNLRL